ncbi:MAG: porin [Acidobacteriia bacterium]|nr:porin [Terriglobia bacterium]
MWKTKAFRLLAAIIIWPGVAHGQTQATPAAFPAGQEAVQKQLDELRRLVVQLSTRINGLEEQLKQKRSLDASSAAPETTDLKPVVQAAGAGPGVPAATASERSSNDFLQGATLNLTIDGYYAYNFNRPIGRVNLLRPYDVSSNSFSLNQATVILERAADPTAGRRFGARMDLQYGQATETLQGNAANEPRPQVYRPVFQAYGTYVAPIGKGLTIDFGKFASAMGYEGNYSKDQFNYSRAYFFNFLPFYHMGFRNTYTVNDKLTLSYWLINGVQQTEDFNGFKSQVVQVIVKPAKTVQWNFIYHIGREQRDLQPALNPGFPALPTQPGLSTTPIVPTPDGRFHLLDTYICWNASPKLTLVGEADYVINRQFETSAPAHVSGGAAYVHYQFIRKSGVAARAEYLSDRGGMFSGVTQALKETTLTYEYKLADGFLTRFEWRRDFSNQAFFLTETPGQLKKEQNTATVGLVWWWGQKQGSW